MKVASTPLSDREIERSRNDWKVTTVEATGKLSEVEMTGKVTTVKYPVLITSTSLSAHLVETPMPIFPKSYLQPL